MALGAARYLHCGLTAVGAYGNSLAEGLAIATAQVMAEEVRIRIGAWLWVRNLETDPGIRLLIGVAIKRDRMQRDEGPAMTILRRFEPALRKCFGNFAYGGFDFWRHEFARSRVVVVR